MLISRLALGLIVMQILWITGCTNPLQKDVSTGYSLKELPRASLEDYALSPDGQSIVASYYGEDQRARLLRIDVNTGASEPLLDSEGVHLRSPSFSGDGTLLAYVATEFGDFGPIGVRHRILVMDVASRDSHQIGETGYWVQAASISPSGDNVFFIMGTERGFKTPWLDPVNQADIYHVSSNGGALKRATRLELDTIRDLAALSDDQVVVSVFHRPREGERYEGIFAINVETSSLNRLPLVLRRYPDAAPYRLCASEAGNTLSAGGQPATVFDFARDSYRIFGNESIQEPCFDDGSGRLFFLCQDERWGPRHLMQLEESGQRERIFPSGPLVPRCVS